MKKLILVLSLHCAFFASNLTAQWFWQYPFLQGKEFYEVYLIHSNTGWVGGQVGTMLKTTNSGVNWTSQSSGTTRRLYSVYFKDFNTGWTVGQLGTICSTTNGGVNWTEQYSGILTDLYSVYFTDSNTGWAVGDMGKIIKTTNGGVNWTSQSSGTTNVLYSVYFTDSNTGWTVGWLGTILKTTNGGVNWTEQSSGVTGSFSVYFTDSNTGWAVGWNGIIIKTTNSGANWIAQSSGSTNHLRSVHFTDSNAGWAVGEAGIIIKTTNSGVNWIAQSSGTTNYLRSVYFTDSNTGWAVGEAGIIIKTTNGGENWVAQSSGATNYLRSVYFTDSNTGWVVGDFESGAVPIELTSFTAVVKGKTVELKWQTATEVNNYGFEVERKYNSKNWCTIGFKEGHGTTTQKNSYSFNDNNLSSGKYSYRLKQIDCDGSFEYFNIVEIEVGAPTKFELSQNYPNPFNPSTKIKYAVSRQQYATLKVYDILGNEIETLVNEEKSTGTYEVTWNAVGMTSGVYFYQLRTGSFVDTKKMILMH